METEILSLEAAKKIAKYEKYVPILLKIIERNKNNIAFAVTNDEFFAIEILKMELLKN